MLSNDRIEARGVSPHPHEQEAIDFVIRALPDRDPFRLWALVDLVDTSGRRYDLDLVVLGYHAVYLIEIKSHPGRFTGDAVDWQVTFPDGRSTLIANPLRLTAHKARVLASMLARRLPNHPYVQELVFLSDPNVDLGFAPADRNLIVTRATFERAITFGEFQGASSRLLGHRIDRPLAQRTTEALLKIGLRDSVASRKVGNLVLTDVLLDRPGYQDHAARNERLDKERARVRTYQIAHGTTAEQRGQLVRAAEREASMLSLLSDHPSILRLKSYVAEGPTGAPCVVFDDFKDGTPLDAFLRANPALSLDERVGLIQTLAEALGYCHRKDVLHRGLAPSAVLVRRKDDGKLELRLFNFQLAIGGESSSSGTVHLSSWVGPNEDVYVAPEVLERPTHASRASDVFSLGAIAYLVLTGRPPGESLPERESLMQLGYLSLATARDAFAAGIEAQDEPTRKNIEAAMQVATAKKAPDRWDDPVLWADQLVDALTTPTPAAAPSFVDPLLARKGDEIAPNVRVEAVLGTGSTARTLRVKIGDSVFALKVALSADQDERVRREGQILAELDSDRIVRLHETLTVGERVCLRMTDAGDTLAHVLAEEGVPSLDFARRWGEDLLYALYHLEERGVQHRDIKPGNLGVLAGEQKKKRHLFLFDFSLSSIDPKEVGAGTPLYRDPFLYLRGRWDDAADRYAAALTLHELLTGDRPRWGQGDIASASDGPIALSAERFDAAVRERLVAFFTRALDRDVNARFASADEMRVEWTGCFARLPVPSAQPDEDAGAEPQDLALPAGLDLGTPVEALPLSVRAKNALDRAGVLQMRELLAIPNNQLSSMRGVGHGTWRDIRTLLDRPELAPLRERAQAEARTAELFAAEYAGPATSVRFVAGLSPTASVRLENAGLHDLAAVAQTPRKRLALLLKSDQIALEALLTALSRAAPAQADTGSKTLEQWLERFLPAAQKRGDKPLAHVRVLFGLDPAPGGRYVESASDAAAALGVSRALIYAAVTKLREQWAHVPELPDLADKVSSLLEAAFRIAPLDELSEVLLRELNAASTPRSETDPERLRQARALVRVAIELSLEWKLTRVHGAHWVVPEAFDPKPLAEIGALADTLAASDPLLSAGAVQDRLREHLASDPAHPLAQLPGHRLVALAALASSRAAKSARLELYTRGLQSARALDLCVTGLPAAKLSPELLQQIVRARYPEAEPLPEGGSLRALMQDRGYVFDAVSRTFERERPRAQTGTEGPLPRSPTTHTGHRSPDPDAHQFAQDIRVREKRGSFCVLEVVPARAADTATELQHRLGVTPVSLEAALLAELRLQISGHGVEPSVVYATDREGPKGTDWPNLRDLMRLAASSVLARLLASGEPLVLTDPGLLARYELHDFVRGLVEHTRKDDAPAVFLIVPTDEEAGGPRIRHPEGDLAIPLTSPAQRLRVPRSWLENRDRSA